MSTQTVRTTIVNHVSIDIAASPDAVWHTILEEYVEAGKFREYGYAIERISDPGYLPQSYRMRLLQDGVVADERHCFVTELDEAEHRLSMYADYSISPDAMLVYVTYRAQEIAGGTRYSIDCHTALNVDAEPKDGKSVSEAIVELRAQYGAALHAYLDSVRARLEAPA